MDRRNFLGRMTGSSMVLALARLSASPVVAQPSHDGRQKEFRMSGRYIEACSCSVPCPCPMLEAFREHCTAINLTKEQGKQTLTFDDGRTFSAVIEPVLGADGKTPIRIVNSLMPWLPTIMQGRTIQGEYRDGDLSFILNNTNAFFNDDLRYAGAPR